VRLVLADDSGADAGLHGAPGGPSARPILCPVVVDTV
jgi:hypothetical protein